MRTRAVLGSIFASTAILVMGWQAGDAVLAGRPATVSQTTGGDTGSSTLDTGSATAAQSLGGGTGSTAGAGSAADRTYTGSSITTRFGPVQVAVTISDGEITDVTAVRLTDRDGKSVQISNRAAPILRDEVLASQSANVSNVSGATYTSAGYLQSLQSALDQAGL